MVNFQWDEAPEDWPKIGGYPCLCGILCESFTICAVSPTLFCGERVEYFFLCCEEKGVCVCKEPMKDDNILGYHVEGDCALVKPKLLIQQRALGCCCDYRCALPPTDEQPLLCGLFPFIGLFGTPPQ